MSTTSTPRHAAPEIVAPVAAPASTPAVVVAESPADGERRRRLVRMKITATGLLGVMAVIFVIAYLAEQNHPGFGYLRAAAEAGMVGALADWFAVTALFRHPLGLRIPHTAIIPNRKNAIGESLSEFVATNFLSEAVVREKLARVSVAQRVGVLLDDPGNARRIVDEIATAAMGFATMLRDDQVAGFIETMVRKRVEEFRVGPPLGRIAAEVFERGDHRPLVDVLIDRVHDWIQKNPTAITSIVSERAPAWTPKFLDTKVSGRIYKELEAFLSAVRSDKEHPLRGALDRLLVKFADDLQHDPATMAKAESIKDRLLNNDAVRGLAASAWTTVKTTLLSAADDPESELRRGAVTGIQSFGRRLGHDAELAAKVDGWVGDAVGYLARNHARSVTGIIDETIARWDGNATSRKIELQVGRDLQFIRINGTVVGALAGLVIYTLAHLLLR